MEGGGWGAGRWALKMTACWLLSDWFRFDTTSTLFTPNLTMAGCTEVPTVITS